MMEQALNSELNTESTSVSLPETINDGNDTQASENLSSNQSTISIESADFHSINESTGSDASFITCVEGQDQTCKCLWSPSLW